MYRDDAFFKANLPFYGIRPLYIFLSSVVGFLIGNDVMATSVVAAISTALAMILSYAIAQRIGPPTGTWRLVVPLAWAVSGGLSLATNSTPDALAALVTLLFVYVWIGGPWTRGRLLRLMLLSGLMVAARTDSVVFLMSLLLSESLFEPRHRSPSRGIVGHVQPESVVTNARNTHLARACGEAPFNVSKIIGQTRERDRRVYGRTDDCGVAGVSESAAKHAGFQPAPQPDERREK
jgi:Dolichyl-phosphate-mannose-protein mannosyltransferase